MLLFLEIHSEDLGWGSSVKMMASIRRFRENKTKEGGGDGRGERTDRLKGNINNW